MRSLQRCHIILLSVVDTGREDIKDVNKVDKAFIRQEPLFSLVRFFSKEEIRRPDVLSLAGPFAKAEADTNFPMRSLFGCFSLR